MYPQRYKHLHCAGCRTSLNMDNNIQIAGARVVQTAFCYNRVDQSPPRRHASLEHIRFSDTLVIFIHISDMLVTVNYTPLLSSTRQAYIDETNSNADFPHRQRHSIGRRSPPRRKSVVLTSVVSLELTMLLWQLAKLMPSSSSLMLPHQKKLQFRNLDQQYAESQCHLSYKLFHLG